MTSSNELFLFQREKKLIALMYVLGKAVSRTDLQKLLFLFCRQEPDMAERRTNSATYDFVPYKYGAFSFTSLHDLGRLQIKRIIEIQGEDWQLTTFGRNLASTFVTNRIKEFSQRYERLRGDKLIAKTYQKHPFSAINSTIIGRVLHNDPVTRRRVREVTPTLSGGGLFTIGYQERSLEEYVNRLIKNNIKLLFDVRQNPVSRRYGFSKKVLNNVCSRLGIEYQHLRELGIETHLRDGIHEKQTYDAVFEHYRNFTLPERQDKIQVINKQLLKGNRIALTCFERNHEQCHRSILSDYIKDNLSECKVYHI
ncbi:MAG: DUF488 domain-containing protein [Gammaproteobacteria bacterium]|nr:DUF488 domain-containing protein [Gammaproteobacteria bacterium]MYK43064.1 DUF488 domain-containing protein [Gammaproteobacteria bacterium]